MKAEINADGGTCRNSHLEITESKQYFINFKVMFKQIKIWSVITLMLFACNENEQDIVQPSSKKAEFLKVIKDESTAMLESSFDDLNNVFSTSSVEELRVLDTREFSKTSVLDYSRRSDLFSPYYDVIEATINSDNISRVARARRESVFSEEEQRYVNVLTNAFSLLPDRDAFGEEVKRVESEITISVSDEGSRLKLLALTTSSMSSINYLFDNEDKIMKQM